jgi:hypothetical protein
MTDFRLNLDGSPLLPYDPARWCWIAGGDESRWWSAAAGGWIVADGPAADAFVAAGGVPTRIADETELVDVLVQAGLPERAPTLPPANERLAALARIDRKGVEIAGFVGDEIAGRKFVAEDDPRLEAAMSVVGLKSETDAARQKRAEIALEVRLGALESGSAGT